MVASSLAKPRLKSSLAAQAIKVTAQTQQNNNVCRASLSLSVSHKDKS